MFLTPTSPWVAASGSASTCSEWVGCYARPTAGQGQLVEARRMLEDLAQAERLALMVSHQMLGHARAEVERRLGFACIHASGAGRHPRPPSPSFPPARGPTPFRFA